MKLAIICGSGYISGKEVVALELIAGLRDAGHQVDVATTMWENGELTKRLQAANVPTHPMRLGYISATLRLSQLRMTVDQLIHLPALYLRYRRFLRDVSPDKIVHTNWQHLLLLLPFLKPERDLFWVHEIVPNTSRYQKLFAALSRRLSRFVAVSEAVAQSILQLGVSGAQVVVIHNGLSELNPKGSEYDRSDRAVRLGIVGQVGPWKGHDDLLTAFAQLLRQGPMECELHIFGTGSGTYCDHLRNLATDLKLNEKIKWHGFVSDRAKIYQKIDICVVPSRFEEPFGLVAVEAAMAGLPCIATKRGGLPEIVQDQITGLLVESENPDELARALRRLVEDPDARRRMGEAAPPWARERFGRKRMVAEFADLLEK